MTRVIRTTNTTLCEGIRVFYQRHVDRMEGMRADALKVCAFTQQESADMQSDIDHAKELLGMANHPPHIVERVHQRAFVWSELPERIKRGIAYAGRCSLEALREAWGLEIG